MITTPRLNDPVQEKVNKETKKRKKPYGATSEIEPEQNTKRLK